MIGRRVTIALALLIALLCTAFAAQSASAVQGTTAFTCVEGGATKDFKDAHCDTPSAVGEGTFGHVEIGEGKTTELEITNAKTKNGTSESTPATFTLKGPAGSVEVTCETVSGTSSNVNAAAGVDGLMANEGKELKVKFQSCKVKNKAAESYEKGCDVQEPLELTGTSTTRVGLGPEKSTMGVEFKPGVDKEGKSLPFVNLIFTHKGKEKCPLGTNTIPIDGTALATGSRGSNESVSSSGGTMVFTKEMTGETLKWGGFQALFEGTMTLSVSGKGNPITFTTTSK